ncbi:DNA-directed RNA polymerase sigma-70 factor [Bacteroidia bacterium]|nr:DNA-directed RNA polymerase sigma-70 factor [Bacteroidia bacterium]
MVDDYVLLDMMREGSERGFKQVFVKFYSPLCEYASQYISDDDAEELVQELMIYIWENRELLIIETSLKSYLFTAIKHRCLNAIKKHQCRQRVRDLIYEKIKDQFEDPDYYLANELAVRIQKAISELPEPYREVFIRSRFTDCTNKQIAKKLGISIKTVEYRITQSLKILSIKLKDSLPLFLALLRMSFFN